MAERNRSRFFCCGALLVLCLALISPVTAQEAAPPWAADEALFYDVSWKIFPAGVAQMQVSEALREGHRVMHVQASARSTGLVAALYKVEDFFDSDFDPATLCSRGIHKRTREGWRQRDTRIHFDSARKLSLLEERDPSKPEQPPKFDQNPIESCTRDVLSAIYYVRQLPLAVGRTFDFPINDGGRTYRVQVEVQAREEVKTGIGPVAAFRVEAKVFEGLFRRKGRLWVWYSDDAKRIPVQMRARIAWGTLTGSLSRIEGRR